MVTIYYKLKLHRNWEGSDVAGNWRNWTPISTLKRLWRNTFTWIATSGKGSEIQMLRDLIEEERRKWKLSKEANELNNVPVSGQVIHEGQTMASRTSAGVNTGILLFPVLTFPLSSQDWRLISRVDVLFLIDIFHQKVSGGSDTQHCSKTV